MINIITILTIITIIVIIIFTCIIIGLIYNNYNNNNKSNKNSYEQQIHKELYDILPYLIKILDENNINYFIIGGTLLGSYREGNIISHDDDIDIGLLNSDYKKFINLNDSIFDKYNIKKMVCKDHNYLLCKILKKGNNNINAFIDIFSMNNYNNKIHFSLPEHRQYWPNSYYFINELYPLTYYKLNKYKVKGPAIPENYLYRHYGNDWKIPKQTHNHKFLTLKPINTC